MSTSATPISLPRFVEAIRDLELSLLHNEKARLQNSIFHLRRSNASLEGEIEIINSEGIKDEESLKVLQEAVEENKEVIARQDERIKAVEEELVRRGLGKECGDAGQEEAPAENGEPAAPTQADEEEGVYL